MNSFIFQILPILLLLLLYLFIFTRKGEVQRVGLSFKGYDWLTFIAVILGGTVLASATSALNIKMAPWLSIALMILLFLVLFIVVVYRARAGRPIVQRLGDERMGLIYAKSARNAFFATYLAFFIQNLLTDKHMLDTMWLSIVLASGLLVLIVSVFFYYYSKS